MILDVVEVANLSLAFANVLKDFGIMDKVRNIEQ